MGCGGSKEPARAAQQEKPKEKYRDEHGNTLEASVNKPQYDVNDPDVQAVLTRQDSAAVKTEEPGGFVSKVKQMYQTRKAKLNGANEDVDQYMDEIMQSIPVMSRKDRDRVQQWINAVWDANLPGPTFSEVVEGIQPRTAAGTAVVVSTTEITVIPPPLAVDSTTETTASPGVTPSVGRSDSRIHRGDEHHPLAVPHDDDTDFSAPKTPMGNHLFNASTSDHPRSANRSVNGGNDPPPPQGPDIFLPAPAAAAPATSEPKSAQAAAA